MFNKKLLTLRKCKGMERKELADKLGVSLATITRYEKGDREPNIETIQKISSIFQVPINDLISTDTNTEEMLNHIIVNDFCKWLNDFFSKEDINNHDLWLMQRNLETSLVFLRKISEYEDTKKASALYSEIKDFILFKSRGGE